VQQPSCPNASAASQQYINKPGGRFAVRCGPQAEPPVTYRPSRQQSSVENLPLDTRVVPRHVYENRQNTTNVSVPAGYKAAWDDDRLNPYRAERTLRPAEVKGIVSVPAGYRLVDWGDNRLNLRRGVSTAAGETQASQIWSNTVPRKLITVRTGSPDALVPVNSVQAQATQTGSVTRISTRSAPAAAVAAPAPAPVTVKRGRYVRVAVYAGEAEARAIAKALAGTGLPMRLGAVKSSNQRVVLAGPFTSSAQAKAALNQLRGAGYLEARMNR
jgi:sporulation related protein